MTALRSAPAKQRLGLWARLREFGGWWLEPGALIRLPRPVAMLASALLVFVLGYGAGNLGDASQAGPVAQTGAPAVYVQFRLEAEGAHEVRLAGSFSEWRPEVELREVQPGVWATTVPLQPGVYDYAFVVDGETWMADPYATSVDDGFGGTNSRLPVLVPEAAA